MLHMKRPDNTKLPPSNFNADIQVRMLNYSVYIWKNTLDRQIWSPSPVENGWDKNEDDILSLNFESFIGALSYVI